MPEQAACGHDILALRSARQRPEDLNFPAALYDELQPTLYQLPQARGGVE